MKQLLLLFSLLIGATAGYAQDVYVNGSAADGGDGTTWATAYNDLTVALNAATPGSNVWVAAGTYVTPDSSSFVIDEELSLYGGFAGTETAVDQADPAANVTILSGDVLGNDPADMSYDSTLMDENNRVLAILDTTEAGNTYRVTLDGFTITNGVIAFDGGFSLSGFGGGIYATATVDVSRVRFTRNRANYGSATGLVFPSSTGSTFMDIVSEGNYEGGNGTHYSFQTDSLSFINAMFVGNEMDTLGSGIIYADGGSAAGTSLIVDNATFSDIIAPVWRGAAIQTANFTGVRVSNSDFTNCFADLGGALYIRSGNNLYSGDRPVSADDCIIDNCTFTDIVSQRWGGTLFFGNQSHRISNSTFTNGLGAQTAGAGGAIYAQNSDTLFYEYSIQNSQFQNNITPRNGGAIFYFTDNVDVEILGSDIAGSSGGFGGAMLLAGAGADTQTSTRIDSCTFTSNAARATGGAIYVENERFDISNTEFSGNLGSAGTIGAFGSLETNRISNCSFLNNGSTTNPYNIGSAIFARLNGGGEVSDSLFIENTTFTGNQSTREPGFVSGGTIYVRRGNQGSAGMPYVEITNSDFVNNSALEDAQGGAIYAQDGSMIRIMDSEFLTNSSGGGGGAFFARQFTQTIQVIDTVAMDTSDVVIPYPNNIPTFDVHRSLFIANTAGSQGGVADLQSGQMNMTNSIVLNNAVTQGEGSGGGIIINGTDDYAFQSENTFVNNTFYGNTDGGREGTDSLLGASGNAIALFQQIGEDSAADNSVTLTIQNNIFFQDQGETDAEALGIEQTGADGTIIVNSLGGNYFNSNPQPGFVINAVGGAVDVTDLDIDVTDIFVDALLDDPLNDFPDLDLIRGDGSNPLIDAGTTGPLVPEVDYFNEMRDDMPDIGAIEYNGIRVDVAEPIANSGLDMDFFPNPTVDVVNIVNNEAGVSDFTVLVSDMQGRYVTGRTFGSGKNVLNIRHLPTGTYNLSLLIDGKVYSQQIMKK